MRNLERLDGFPFVRRIYILCVPKCHHDHGFRELNGCTQLYNARSRFWAGNSIKKLLFLLIFFTYTKFTTYVICAAHGPRQKTLRWRKNTFDCFPMRRDVIVKNELGWSNFCYCSYSFLRKRMSWMGWIGWITGIIRVVEYHTTGGREMYTTDRFATVTYPSIIRTESSGGEEGQRIAGVIIWDEAQRILTQKNALKWHMICYHILNLRFRVLY